MKKTCFVIIGFGIKTDFETGRRLNLDATFENVIKPVFDGLDIVCYRACDIGQTGVIDTVMYENILKSDFVVADISTLNPNAIYELGVRHALKPNTTIVIAEDKVKIPFDVNHVFIHTYKHLEEDIGVSEANRFKAHLKGVVEKFIDSPKTDSPVYTFIPYLNPPTFSEQEVQEIEDNIEKFHSTADLVELAEEMLKNKDYPTAKQLLKKALEKNPADSFITQRLALVTYKSKQPNEEDSLNEALEILKSLNPNETTDPETLGLHGAIYKRLYSINSTSENLNLSLHYYERGYYVKQDYYNGINVAFLYALKSVNSIDTFEKFSNYGQALKIWKEIIAKWELMIKDDSFKERGDKEWIYLTLAEAYFGINNIDKELDYLSFVKELPNSDFAISSYEEQRIRLSGIKSNLDEIFE